MSGKSNPARQREVCEPVLRAFPGEGLGGWEGSGWEQGATLRTRKGCHSVTAATPAGLHSHILAFQILIHKRL